MIKRIVSACVMLCAAGSVMADTPINPFNQTSRTIMVQIDEDFANFGSVGSSFGAKLTSSWTSNGSVGTITVPGGSIENLVSNVFSGVSAVPGSFTNYVIQIDLSNGNVIAADLSGQVVLPIVGTQGIIQTATSTEVAGFNPTNLFGIEYPAHCTGGSGCNIVPGSGYDITTGQVNAVGKLNTLVQVFSPFGDLRFTELPAEPFCDVDTSQASYVDGEVTALSVLRFANFGGADIVARLLVELKYNAAAFTGTAFDVGSDSSLVLPTGWDVDSGPQQILPVQEALPRGTWGYRCAIVDPVTGDVYAEDTAEFEIQ